MLALQTFFAPDENATIERAARAALTIPGAECAFTYGAVPHLTTGSWRVDDAQLSAAVAGFRERVGALPEVTLEVELGAREWKDGRVTFFLLPRTSEALLAYHAEIHRRLGYDFAPFRPKDVVGNWWPHVTLFTVPGERRAEAEACLAPLREVRTLRASAAGLVGFEPIRTLVEHPFGTSP